jgi:membrane-associated phospholipid phosphatase
MIKKLIVGFILLSTQFFNLSAYADSVIQPPQGTEPLAVSSTTKTDDTSRSVPATPPVSSDSSDDVDSVNLKYLKGYFVDSGKIIASPLHWEAKDWLKAGLVLGVTSSLFLVDKEVKNFSQSHQSPVASKFASVGNGLGNGLYTLPPLGAFYLYGSLADDSRARRASLLSLESFAISGVMTSGMKLLAERHRPNTGDSSTTWDGPHLSLKNVSFSSGHTASAFSIATVFADEYKGNFFIPPLAYGLATLTGLSRIYSNEHWASDVFFGAAIGYFTSKALLWYHKEDKNKKKGHLSIMPAVGKEMTGLSVKYEF